jgi:hypothetical protein
LHVSHRSDGERIEVKEHVVPSFYGNTIQWQRPVFKENKKINPRIANPATIDYQYLQEDYGNMVTLSEDALKSYMMSEGLDPSFLTVEDYLLMEGVSFSKQFNQANGASAYTLDESKGNGKAIALGIAGAGLAATGLVGGAVNNVKAKDEYVNRTETSNVGRQLEKGETKPSDIKSDDGTKTRRIHQSCHQGNRQVRHGFRSYNDEIQRLRPNHVHGSYRWDQERQPVFHRDAAHQREGHRQKRAE